jgi:transposase-like protein
MSTALEVDKVEEALRRLNEGQYISDVATALGVSERTVLRWKQKHADRVTKNVRTIDAVTNTLHEVVQAAKEIPSDRIQEELQTLKDGKDEARKYFERLGKSFLIKAIRRLQDLPDEAIRPETIPQYADMALKLIRYAHEGAVEDLQIHKLIEQLVKPKEDAGQSREPKKIVRVVVDPKGSAIDGTGD